MSNNRSQDSNEGVDRPLTPSIPAKVLLFSFHVIKFVFKGVAYSLASLGFLFIFFYAMNHLTSWKLIYNHTSSMPEGVYLIHEGQHPTHIGQIVVVRYHAPKWAYKEGITGKTEKFIKKIGALPGDHVIIRGRSIYRCPDASTPIKQCNNLGRRVQQHFDGYTFPGVFLSPVVPKGKMYLESDSPLGFDSRYLGYFRLSKVIGVAHPILTYGPNYPLKLG